MRHKYRAFDKGKMVYQPLDTIYGLYRFFGFLTEDAILMQWTGRKDKNGKSICESDIVDYTSINGTDTMHFSVDWDESKCGFVLGGIGSSKDYWNREWTPQRAEIIGNIHDNPELLEVKEQGK